MNAIEYFFPKDLLKKEIQLKKILLIGGCLNSQYINLAEKKYTELKIDHITVNNIQELPNYSEDEIAVFDLIFVQLPLRSLLSDNVIRLNEWIDRDGVEAVFNEVLQKIPLIIENYLKYNLMYGKVTLLSNFIEPQLNTSRALDQRSNSLGRLIQLINFKIEDLINNYSNVYLLDMNNLAASFGKRFFLDDVTDFYAHNYYLPTKPDWSYEIKENNVLPVLQYYDIYDIKGDEFVQIIFEYLNHFFRIYNQVDEVKLVIFDLDNTLWRGLIAEDYSNSNNSPAYFCWPTGIWEIIQILRSRGIIVSICSKNDVEIVKSRWHKASPLGWISFDDFINPKINWKKKSENILELISELNLTPKSVVFVDDNPVEREEVISAIKDIRVIGGNQFETRRILNWSSETQKLHISKESLNREKSYIGLINKINDSKKLTREEFLNGLDIKINFNNIDNKNIDKKKNELLRSIELLNKTNQFNTTNISWSLETLKDFIFNEGTVFIFQVSDKYSDYGNVGCILVQENIIKQYVMSCRVLGMDIEHNVLLKIISEFYKGNILYAMLVESELNTPCRDVFIKAGFELISNENIKIFSINNANNLISSHIVFN